MFHKRFKYIYLEITNICQFNCSFCPKTTRAAASMSLDQISHIFSQISAYTDNIYLHVLGEPLLHNKLNEIIILADQFKLKVNITTNGYALKEKQALLLNHPNLKKVNISLHSIEDEGHQDLNMEQYLDNVWRFTELLLKQDTTTIIYRLWNTNKHYTMVMDFLKQKFPDINFKHQMTSLNGLRLAYRLFLSQDNQFEWPTKSTKPEAKAGYCLGLKSHIAILVNGDVVPCCLDSEGTMVLGNIFLESLDSIMEKERTINIIKGFQAHQAVEALCQKCSYKERFNS